MAHTGLRVMRLPAQLIAFVLVVLLASTTPVGTGSGSHQFDLLHPLFTHVHLVNGRIVTHEELARAQAGSTETRATPGPSLGSGGIAGADGGLGVSPAAPGELLDCALDLPCGGAFLEELRAPLSRKEAPPEPPPL